MILSRDSHYKPWSNDSMLFESLLLLSAFLSSWCFQVQTSWNFEPQVVCWGCSTKKKWFRFEFLAKHKRRNSFNTSCSIQTLRHLGPECTQESHVTGLHSTDHRFPPRAFPGVFPLWGGGRFAAHTGHLSPRRGDRIWGGSRKGREGEECSGNFHCDFSLFSICFNP